MKKLDFQARVEVDRETGRTLAVYLQIRSGHATKVIELASGAGFANYDRNGRLLGVELLAPCNVAVFDQLTEAEPKEVKDFFLNEIPRGMAVGA